MKNIQAQMKELFGNSCYAYCLTRYFLKTDDIKTLTRFVLEGWVYNYIDNDGFVSKPLQFIKLICGKQYRDIKKPAIKSLAELPEANYSNEGLFIVEYKKTPDAKESHFVIANRSGVVWDPSGSSITVQTGAPFSYREFVDY